MAGRAGRGRRDVRSGRAGRPVRATGALTSRTPRRALLDTSVVIDFPAAEVAEIAAEVAVSAVTIAELQFGVTSAADPLTQLRRRRRVQAILDRFEVLPFDVVTAEHYGVLATLVGQSGRNPRPRPMDLQIAATAACHGLILLTRNGSDFRRSRRCGRGHRPSARYLTRPFGIGDLSW
ncbi:MAG: type II toxin-antitoxin system VapC family toxin [Dermatophilaceae bacterium]